MVANLKIIKEQAQPHQNAQLKMVIQITTIAHPHDLLSRGNTPPIISLTAMGLGVTNVNDMGLFNLSALRI